MWLSIPLVALSVLATATSVQAEWLNPSDRSLYESWPEDRTAVTGERVVLPCRTAKVEARVQWTQDEFGLGMDRQLVDWDRYRIVGNDKRESAKGYGWQESKRQIFLYLILVPQSRTFLLIIFITT